MALPDMNQTISQLERQLESLDDTLKKRKEELAILRGKKFFQKIKYL